MSHKPTYDDPLTINEASAVISYINPLGHIDTFMFTRIPPNVLRDLVRLLRNYEKRDN